MYKTSLALASVLALADALHLNTSCNPCCDGGHGEEIDDGTLEVIGETVKELVDEEDETEDYDCRDLTAGIMAITEWDQLEVLTFDKINEDFDQWFASNDISIQEAGHWYKMLTWADKDGDNKINENDIEAICRDTGFDQFNYFAENAAYEDYSMDHTIDGLVGWMFMELDKDKNGNISLYHAGLNLPPYVEDGTITQAEADTYYSIIEAALAVPGNDYLGVGAVLITAIKEYMENNDYYFDWRNDGLWQKP